MHVARPRGVRPAAAPLVICLAAVVAVSGCSGSSSPSAAPQSSAKPTGTPVSSAPTVDPAAQTVVALALRATQAQRSYTFTATERISAGTSATTHLSGRLVRGQGLAYTLVAQGRRTQVIRLTKATYLRPVPGRWSRLRKPRHLVNPTATLLTVLHRMTPTRLVRNGADRVVSGVLPVA